MKSFVFILLLAAACGVTVGLTREYIFVGAAYNWYSAQWHCRQYYRDLATFTSTEEKQRLFQQHYTYNVWIGLHKSSTSPWTWSDGEPFQLQSWNGYMPYCYYVRDECCLYTHQGNWYSWFCDSNDKDNYHDKDNDDWLYFYCYRFLVLVKEKKTWDEALEFCRTNYTGLASVISDWSLSQIKLETVGTETESVWTGLHFMNGQWCWVNEEQLWIPFASLNSMPSCPHLSYRCGGLNITTNTFDNYNCNHKMNFVCYWA